MRIPRSILPRPDLRRRVGRRSGPVRPRGAAAARPRHAQGRRRLAALPRADRRQRLAGNGPRRALAEGGAAHRLANPGRRGLRRRHGQPRPAVSLRPRRGPAAPPLPQERDRRCPLEFEYPTDYKDLYNYSGGAALLPGRGRRPRLHLGPEGMLHCLRAEDGKVIWKKDIVTDFRVVQNFFGVGSTPVDRGRPADRPGRRQPQGRTDERPSLELQGPRQRRRRLRQVHRQSQVPRHRRVGQLFLTGAGDDRRPPLVLRLRARRPARFGPVHRQGGFSLPLEGANPGERQRLQPGGGRRPRLHLGDLRPRGGACWR